MRIEKLVLPGIVALGCMTFGCNSSSNTVVATPQATTVKTTISDPAACQAPNGEFAHVYVTVTDVEVSTNADAGPGDSSFVDLTPTLKAGAPMQIDLLGQANNNCFLASLGSTTELPAGNYQQIRIMIAPDSAAGSVTQNACGSFANCVVLSDGSTHDLALSSEAKTGLKIPAGQIEDGQFVVGTGQTEDLDVDFNTCSSIVQEGNGQYRLKPVLHAGEVSTTSTSINGTIVNSKTNKPIVGGTVVVAVEQPDATGVDRVLMTTVADPVTGGFVFCPLATGSYDIVAVGVDGNGIAYSAGVETGLQPGNTAGNIPLVPSGTQATINGLVTSQNGAATATAADVRVAALQQATASGLMVTLPLLPSQNATDGEYETASASTCPTGTDCSMYTVQVPAAWPNAGVYAATGATFTQSTALPVNDTIDVRAENTDATPDCSTSEIKINLTAQIGTTPQGPLALTPGGIVTAATAAFVGCQ